MDRNQPCNKNGDIKRHLISLILLLLCGPTAIALTIVSKEEAPYFGNDLPGKGLSREIVETALKRAGYQPSFVFETWPRAYEGGLIGVYDAIGSIWFTEQRAKELAYSDPYLFHEIKFIKRTTSPDIEFNSLDDLHGLLIGILKGYAYSDAFLQSRQFTKIPQNHLLQNLLLLKQGIIDLTLGEQRKIRHELNKYMKNQSSEMTILPKTLVRKGAHIAISKNNPRHKEIIDGFNKALKAMKADGSYDRIINKYEVK